MHTSPVNRQSCHSSAFTQTHYLSYKRKHTHMHDFDPLMLSHSTEATVDPDISWHPSHCRGLEASYCCEQTLRKQRNESLVNLINGFEQMDTPSLAGPCRWALVKTWPTLVPLQISGIVTSILTSIGKGHMYRNYEEQMQDRRVDIVTQTARYQHNWWLYHV